MGGNLVLKLAGEWGRQAPLCAVAAVCPAIDLAAGADALHEPLNRAYEWNFLRGPESPLRAQGELFPEPFMRLPRDRAGRSIREFDHKIVSRYCGFRDADDYYYRAASARVVDRIAVPHVHSVRRTIPSSACFRDARKLRCQSRTSPLWRRARRALRLSFQRSRRTRFTGPRRW
jgi:hypothetical protein